MKKKKNDEVKNYVLVLTVSEGKNEPFTTTLNFSGRGSAKRISHAVELFLQRNKEGGRRIISLNITELS